MPTRSIRPRAEDMRSARVKSFSVWQGVGLLGERAFAPINPAIGSGVGAVQVVCAAGERFSLKPFLAPIGDASVRVGHNTELGTPTDANPSDDVIILGNPPFMGGNKISEQFGDLCFLSGKGVQPIMHAPTAHAASSERTR